MVDTRAPNGAKVPHRKGAAAQARGAAVDSGSDVGSESWLDVGSPGASSARGPATPMGPGSALGTDLGWHGRRASVGA